MSDAVVEVVSAHLSEVVISSLETAAFLFADPVDEALVADPDSPVNATPPFARATVAVVEPVIGAFTLRCQADLLPILATNMMGEDMVSSEALHRDALGEMANVICGAILPILYPDARFRLQAPVVAITDTIDAPTADAFVAHTRFAVDGHLLEGILHLPRASSSAIPSLATS